MHTGPAPGQRCPVTQALAPGSQAVEGRQALPAPTPIAPAGGHWSLPATMVSHTPPRPRPWPWQAPVVVIVLPGPATPQATQPALRGNGSLEDAGWLTQTRAAGTGLSVAQRRCYTSKPTSWPNLLALEIEHQHEDLAFGKRQRSGLSQSVSH